MSAPVKPTYNRLAYWTAAEDDLLRPFVHGRRMTKHDCERIAMLTGRPMGGVGGRLTLLRGQHARGGEPAPSNTVPLVSMRKPVPEVVVVRPRQCIRTDCRVWHTPSSPYVFRCPRCQRLSAE